MSVHHYVYRLKCLLRNRQIVFWTLLFPLVLATLFYMAFSNMAKAEGFSQIPLAVVENQALRENHSLLGALKAVSDPPATEQGEALFQLSYVSLEEAERQLQDNEISGYILADQELTLVVKDSGINQTIAKEFLDQFIQTTSTVGRIYEQNPVVDMVALVGSLTSGTDYLKEVTLGRSAPDSMIVYFYALIAMTCLYGSFWGLEEVTYLQANQSAQGARVSMAPTHKLKLFSASILAAATIQWGVILILLAYMAFVLKIQFGNQIGFILLTSLLGTLTGVSFGTCLATTLKVREGLKVGIIIAVSNFLSFLSGMMYDKMKYLISSRAPLLNYLNPANLIADSFYALYYYDGYEQYFTNLALLCGFIGLFGLITYSVIRRQKYGSL